MDTKNNGTSAILNWALIIAVGGGALGGVQYYFKTRESRSLQSQIANFQNNQAIMNNLIAETMQYSQRNPSIDPILEAIGAKPGKTPAATATKPTGK